VNSQFRSRARRAIEAELHRRVRERRDDPRLEVDLEREHDVERAMRERAPHGGVGTPAPRTIELPTISPTARWPRTSVARRALQPT
jgi:hypothetical protein